MSRKVIITESTARRLFEHEILTEANVKDIISSKEFKDAIKNAIKNERDVKDVTEKQVKDIITKCVTELFKTLWQRNNFWRDTIRNA